MKIFILQPKKKLYWIKFFNKLSKIQYKLTSYEKTPRKIRNFQRLIVKSFVFKLIVITKLLENEFKSNNKFLKILNLIDLNSPIYFQQIWEYNTSTLNINLLNRQSYCQECQYQINQILWIFSCIPIQEKLANCLIWESRLYRNSFDVFEYLKNVLKTNPVRWISFLQFKFFFSKKVKIWLLNHFWIEKKFLINFFSRIPISQIHKEQLWLVFEKSISFKRLLKCFYLIFFCELLKKRLCKLKNKQKNMFFIYYTNLLIFCSETFSYNLTLQYLKKNLCVQNTLQLYYFDFYLLNEGFTLFGWTVKKYKNQIIQQISLQNIQSHQLEIKRFLKSAGNFTIDQIIYCLNKKIILWNNCFLINKNKSFLIKKLNTYLFWRIWFFLRKRHKTKGVKWLIYKYFIKQSNKKWVFYSNNLKLIHYNSSNSNCDYVYLPGYLNSFNKQQSNQLIKFWIARKID